MILDGDSTYDISNDPRYLLIASLVLGADRERLDKSHIMEKAA